MKRNPPIKLDDMDRGSLETFRNPRWQLSSLMDASEPSVFNSVVNAKKYRITFEVIEESREVMLSRLQKLWDESDNYHDYEPLIAEFEKLGATPDRARGNKRREKR